MESRKIEDYAIIGDCETVALVSRDGDIDWLCWPTFSSPACCAALLGSKENGHWSIAPAGSGGTWTRRYRPHTLILETTITMATGCVVQTDFMPIRGRHSDLVRIVHCTEGKVTMQMELCLRFDYGTTVPWVTGTKGHDGDKPAWIAQAGPNLSVLRTAAPVQEAAPGLLSATFTLEAGQRQTFSLTYGCSYEDIPAPIDIEKELRDTEDFWTEWAGRSRYQGNYGEAVERSLITLKALTYRPSGGIVAAPTTSLPERIGGPLNWDYRYCWIRDATLAVNALVEAGYTEEVVAWKQWLIRAIGQDASQVQIMYGLGGQRHIQEWEISWLSGYEGSRPVRAGNVAQEQVQQDIYGEIAAALYHAREAGVPCEEEELRIQEGLTSHLASIWQQPGSGIWEERDKPERFTYSQVMAWLCMDRAVKSIEKHGMKGPAEEWKRLRENIRKDVLAHGYDSDLNAFVQHYQSKQMDASVLFLPIVGFLPAEDHRILGTVRAIEQQLLKDGLLLRNIPRSSEGRQGAFLACSFWLVEVYVMLGRIQDAICLFEKLLSLANDVGLLSEEFDTTEQRLTGNFPQALSHIALVRAAMVLSRLHLS